MASNFYQFANNSALVDDGSTDLVTEGDPPQSDDVLAGRRAAIAFAAASAQEDLPLAEVPVKR
jgi:hypothetical protein